MHVFPSDWSAIALLVFVLGLKHGFDADHLATIDGLTRYNARANPRLARFCGTLFSLGHGAVVVAIAAVVCGLSGMGQVPSWLDAIGAWISIGVLALLGMANLRAVFATPGHETVRLAGVKAGFLGPLMRTARPGVVAGVGALFALSFDTVSQATLFALAGAKFGGWSNALALGLLFTLGMLLTDGINGLWISRLIARADRTARIASRAMSLVVSSLSLLVAGFGVLKILSPEAEAWGEGKELLFGGLVVLCLASSFVLAMRLARSEQAMEMSPR